MYQKTEGCSEQLPGYEAGSCGAGEKEEMMYMVVTINELVQYIRDKIQEQKNYAQQAKTKHDESMRQKHMECVDGYERIESMFLLLKDYLDLEENGRLIELPCKIGDDVWFVPSQTNYKLNILNHHREENKICHQKVARITFSRNGWYLECDKDLEYANDHILIDKMYKETWFLTKSEAEAKLKELRGGENGR